MPSDMPMIFNKVYYVKEFNKKIISIKPLARHDYKVTFKQNTCKIKMPNGGVLTVTNKNNGLFYIKALKSNKNATVSELSINRVTLRQPVLDINEAHEKFGHLSKKLMKTAKVLGI